MEKMIPAREVERLLRQTLSMLDVNIARDHKEEAETTSDFIQAFCRGSMAGFRIAKILTESDLESLLLSAVDIPAEVMAIR